MVNQLNRSWQSAGAQQHSQIETISSVAITLRGSVLERPVLQYHLSPWRSYPPWPLLLSLMVFVLSLIV
jgi:hypothetical protein